MPRNAPIETPIHRCPVDPAGVRPVSTVSASSGTQKNLAGQLGPRRSASRACAATHTAATSGNPTSRTTARPKRTGSAGLNAEATW